MYYVWTAGNGAPLHCATREEAIEAARAGAERHEGKETVILKVVASARRVPAVVFTPSLDEMEDSGSSGGGD